MFLSSRRRALTTLTVTGAVMLLGFNNCSQVALEKAVPLTNASGKVTLCLQDYKPHAYYFRNLNMANYLDRLFPDNDADGLADVAEADFNMDPMKRRSYGATLDSVCLNSYGADKSICEASAGTTCSLTEHKMKFMGLSQCDLKAMAAIQNAVPTSRMTGWDSDQDGIPDFIEVLAGTNSLMASQVDDPDSDGETTASEIANFTNPNFVGVHQSSGTIQSTLTATSDSNCAADAYDIDLKNAPMTQLKLYQSEEFPKLSHDTDENNFIFTVELVHKTNPNDPQIGRRLVYKIFKIKSHDAPFLIQYKDDKTTAATAIEEIQDEEISP